VTSTRPLTLLDQLHELTEEQVGAARSLDGARLQKLTERRADLLFALRVALQDPPPTDPGQRSALAEAARRLALVERRLATVAGAVVDTLDAVLPARPAPTYGRCGRIHGS